MKSKFSLFCTKIISSEEKMNKICRRRKKANAAKLLKLYLELVYRLVFYVKTVIVSRW